MDASVVGASEEKIRLSWLCQPWNGYICIILSKLLFWGESDYVGKTEMLIYVRKFFFAHMNNNLYQ